MSQKNWALGATSRRRPPTLKWTQHASADPQHRRPPETLLSPSPSLRQWLQRQQRPPEEPLRCQRHQQWRTMAAGAHRSEGGAAAGGHGREGAPIRTETPPEELRSATAPLSAAQCSSCRRALALGGTTQRTEEASCPPLCLPESEWGQNSSPRGRRPQTPLRLARRRLGSSTHEGRADCTARFHRCCCWRCVRTHQRDWHLWPQRRRQSARQAPSPTA